MMNATFCPHCKGELAEQNPAGLCPKCLLKAAISDWADLEPADPSKDADPKSLDANGSNGKLIEHPGIGPTVKYFGDYELQSVVAQGGMGVVYRARQVRLNRTVALKMILAGKFASESEIQRFHAEAEAAAVLDHPGIVPVFEVGENGGHHFFSMGFVEGESLAHRLSKGPMSPREAANMLKSIAEAVAYAHQKGIVHRDLKPANVLLDQDDQPRITDFGIAKRIDGIDHLTVTGQVIGTPCFMSPEQATGMGDVTEATDIYSLGVILYYMLVGRPPFQANNPVETLLQVKRKEPVSPRQFDAKISKDIETICLKCLEKNCLQRFQSARELVNELDRFLDERPIVSRPISSQTRAYRWCKRNPVVSMLCATLAFSLVLGVLVSSNFAFKAYEALGQANENARQLKEKDASNQRHLFAAQMNIAKAELARGNIFSMNELLEKMKPAGNEEDLRSFGWNYLWTICKRQLKTKVVATTSDKAGLFKLSKNGKWLALGLNCHVADPFFKYSADTLKIVNLSDGSTQGLIKGKTTTVGQNLRISKVFNEPVFSPNSQLMAAVVMEADVSPAFRKQLRARHLAQKNVRIMIWHVESMKLMGMIPIERFSPGDTVRFSKDNLCLGIFNFNNAKVWSVKELSPQQSSPVFIERLIADRYEPKHFDTDGSNRTFRLPNWTKGYRAKSEKNKRPAEHLFDSKEFGFSPTGSYLAHTSWTTNDGIVVDVIDTKSEKDLFQIALSKPVLYKPWQGHARIYFSKNEKWLAVVRYSSFEVWDIEKSKRLKTINGNGTFIHEFEFLDNNSEVASITWNLKKEAFEANYWNFDQSGNVDTGVKLDLRKEGNKKEVTTRTTVDENGLLVLNRQPGNRYEWRLGTDRLDTNLAESEWVKIQDEDPIRNGFDQVTLSPAGDILCTSGNGGPAKEFGFTNIWRISKRQGKVNALRMKQVETRQMNYCATPIVKYSDDGKMLAMDFSRQGYGDDDLLMVIDLKSFKERRFPSGTRGFHSDSKGLQSRIPKTGFSICKGIEFSPDGTRLFALFELKEKLKTNLVVWDLKANQIESVYERDQGTIRGKQNIAASPNGNLIVTCHADHSICIWDVSKSELSRVANKLKDSPFERRNPAKPVAVLRGHSAAVSSVMFSPDGKVLFSASHDRTIKIWDPVTGDLRLTLEGHKNPIQGIGFEDEGKTLISVGSNNEFRSWRSN